MNSHTIRTIASFVGIASVSLYFLNSAMEKPFLNPKVENGTKWAIALSGIAIIGFPLVAKMTNTKLKLS